MKHNIILKYMLCCMAVFSVAVSCVKDYEPLFDESASARMSAALVETRNLLVAEPGCWLMEYYPHSTQAYGGYTYFLKFTQTEVTAWGEVAESPDKSYTSLYKMTDDDGPVLSFDTFNYVIHYFATPSGSNMNNIYGQSGLYQGYGGDFEFMVLDASASEVTLKGKRSGCLIKMTPFEDDPVAYLQNVESAKSSNFVANLDGTVLALSAFAGDIGGTEYLMTLNRSGRQFTFTPTSGGETTTIAFMYTPEGIKLYQPFKSGDVTIDRVSWDNAGEKANADGIVLENRLPEGWMAYSRYIGTYTLTYNDNEDWYSDDPRTAEVTLEQDKEGESYIMKGVSSKFDVKVNYDLSEGNLSIMGQIVGKYESNSVYFAPMYASRSASGGVTWTGWRSTSYGIKTSADPETLASDPDHVLLKFVPGPSSAGRPINSFGLLMQTPAGASGGWMRPVDENDHKYDEWFIFGDSYSSVFWRDMVKK